MSASRYALRVKKATRPMSQRKNSQPRNADHEKSRWMMKMAVKSSADCQAWNLAHCQRGPTEQGDGSEE